MVDHTENEGDAAASSQAAVGQPDSDQEVDGEHAEAGTDDLSVDDGIDDSEPKRAAAAVKRQLPKFADVPPIPVPSGPSDSQSKKSAERSAPAATAVETESEADRLNSVCDDVLEYQFQDRELLKRCLTHASIARTRLQSNERLEFLGDAIMGAIVCEALYLRFPQHPEGELTRIKSIVVSRTTCAKVTEQLGLQNYIFLGKGLSANRQIPQSILAAVLESVVAGIYLDGGMEAAKEFVSRIITSRIESAAESAHGENYKSMLQQLAQKSLGATPVYRLLDEKGPDHSKCFNVSAVIGARVFPDAWGPSKKEAEQTAAQLALQELETEAAEKNGPSQDD
ncbi:MAG: ribonuclease III [Planctomycetaceae bacterium]|nr:ribonuclease III [Planctomycetaceae bacterium]